MRLFIILFCIGIINAENNLVIQKDETHTIINKTIQYDNIYNHGSLNIINSLIKASFSYIQLNGISNIINSSVKTMRHVQSNGILNITNSTFSPGTSTIFDSDIYITNNVSYCTDGYYSTNNVLHINSNSSLDFDNLISSRTSNSVIKFTMPNAKITSLFLLPMDNVTIDIFPDLFDTILPNITIFNFRWISPVHNETNIFLRIFPRFVNGSIVYSQGTIGVHFFC